MEIQSNPMIARPELKSHLGTEDDTSSTSAKTQRNPRSFPARGFGRGFPSRKPSTGKLMSTPSIPEEQEERSKSLNYSESTEIFGPSESFESSGEHPPPTSSFSCSSSSSQSVSFVLMMLCFLSCSRRIFVTPPALLMTTTPCTRGAS
jgi:hypothetical protein